MPNLLKAREWLTIDETLDYLNHEIYEGHRVTSVDDLFPLIEEGRIPIHWKCLSGHFWLEVDRSKFDFFSTPHDFLTDEITKGQLYGSNLSGYFEIDVEKLDVLPSFSDVVLTELHSNISPELSEIIKLTAKSQTDKNKILVSVDPFQPDDKKHRFKGHALIQIIKEIRVKTKDLTCLTNTLKEEQAVLSESPQNAIELSSKTKNSYLRIINALVDHILGGRTNSPYKDAGNICNQLNGQLPIGEKALATYLKEADNLKEQ